MDSELTNSTALDVDGNVVYDTPGVVIAPKGHPCSN